MSGKKSTRSSTERRTINKMEEDEAKKDVDEKSEENKEDSRPASEGPTNEDTHQSDVDGEEDDETYEVNQILEMRMKGKKRQFLVSWKGYDDTENSWEPEENLGGARDAIREFMANIKDQKPVKKGRKSNASDTQSKGSVNSSLRKRVYREEDEESEHDKQSKESDDDEFEVEKKRGRPSKSAQTPKSKKEKASKNNGGTVQNPVANISRRMNNNLRWLEDDDESDSDESKAATETEKKRSSEEKAQSNTPPALPDIQNDDADEDVDQKPHIKIKLNLNENKEDKKEKVKAEKESVKKEAVEVKSPTKQTPISSTSQSQELSFVGLEPIKNSSGYKLVIEEKGKRKALMLEDAILRDSAGAARFLMAKTSELMECKTDVDESIQRLTNMGKKFTC